LSKETTENTEKLSQLKGTVLFIFHLSFPWRSLQVIAEILFQLFYESCVTVWTSCHNKENRPLYSLYADTAANKGFNRFQQAVIPSAADIQKPAIRILPDRRQNFSYP